MTALPQVADSIDLATTDPLILTLILVALAAVPALVALLRLAGLALRLAGLVLRAAFQLACVLAVVVLCVAVVAGWGCVRVEGQPSTAAMPPTAAAALPKK